MHKVNVKNEYSKLQKVIVNTPRKEIRPLKDNKCAKFLFDSKPNLKKLKKQHQTFIETLERNGVQTIEIRDLLETILSNNSETKKFIQEFLTQNVSKEIGNLTPKEAFEYIISRKNSKSNMNYYVNLFYTRDIGATLSNNIISCNLAERVRNEEGKLFRYILKNHRHLNKNFLDLDSNNSIEGGDILIPKDDCLMIGRSARTSWSGIKDLSKKILKSNNNFEKILVFDLPKKRNYMHLDLIINQINESTFLTDYKKIKKSKHYIIQKNGNTVTKKQIDRKLDNLLKSFLNKNEINLIKSNNKNEQKNCSINILTIEPNKVIAYSENGITNKKLRDKGIDVIEIKGEELIKGKGGPRCMSLPVYRKT